MEFIRVITATVIIRVTAIETTATVIRTSPFQWDLADATADLAFTAVHSVAGIVGNSAGRERSATRAASFNPSTPRTISICFDVGFRIYAGYIPFRRLHRLLFLPAS